MSDNPTHEPHPNSQDPQDRQAFWLEQIREVKDDLRRLNDTVERLSEDVHHYISHHDEWCAGLSKAVGGAAAVLSRFERFVADDGSIKKAEGAWADQDADMT